MTVYIKGMEIPKGCRDCRFEDWGNCTAVRPVGRTRHLSEERESYCPLAEVSKSHGRLIDEDSIMNILDMYKNTIDLGDETLFFREIVDCMKMVINETVPTIIEGSK